MKLRNNTQREVDCKAFFLDFVFGFDLIEISHHTSQVLLFLFLPFAFLDSSFFSGSLPQFSH